MGVLMLLFYDEYVLWPDPNIWQEQMVKYLDDCKTMDFTKEERDGLLFDGWGNKLKYTVNEHQGKARRFVYSLGENGQDEGGEGDDRMVELEFPPPSYQYSSNVRGMQRRLENFALSMKFSFLATGSWPDTKSWRRDIEKYLWKFYYGEFRRCQKYHGERSMFEGEYSIFQDPWGSEIQYVIDTSVEPPKRFFYSFGENQTDEKGAGDDIIAPVNINDLGS